MKKVLTALVLIAGSAMSFAMPASARLANPPACTFIAGFAAFREAVGDEIVGDCLGDQVASEDGGARQRTTEGTLIWNARSNLVTFHDGFHMWTDGPSGIGSDVVIGGLSDRKVSRDSLVVPASIALDMASLGPEDLGDDWDYAETREPASAAVSPRCSWPTEPMRLGSLDTWLVDERAEKRMYQQLTAYAGDGATRVRRRMEQLVAACGTWTLQTSSEPYAASMHIDPFVDLGDESMMLVYEYVGQISGVHKSRHLAYVRYGGLVSQVRNWRERGDTADAAIAEFVWLAKRAHGRVQNAAWYLRP